MSDNPNRNIKNEKCCSLLSRYFKRHVAFKEAEQSLAGSTKT
jgi:hypothetical protein